MNNANTPIAIEFKGSTLSGGAVALLASGLLGGTTTQVAEQVDSGTGAKITHTATAGTYYIRVRSSRGDTGIYAFGLLTSR